MSEPQEIPYFEIDETQASFFMRPIVQTVDPAAWDEPPHRHNYQELIWIHGGNGRHKIDQTLLTIQPHTFYLIAQGQIHHFLEGRELEGFVLRFTDDFLLDTVRESSWDYRMTLFNHFALHRSLLITADEVAMYERHVQRIWREYQAAAFGYLTVVRHLLGILLIRLERTRREMLTSAEALTGDARLYQQFLSLLNAHFERETAVSFYATHLHLTPRQLSSTVAKFSGKSAKQLIQDRRIVEAKRYLRHTNASIKEISYVLGFHDASYFSKAFKKAVGVSPQAYKGNM